MSENILAEIVANKRRELQVRKNLTSLDFLKNSVKPSDKSFYDALNNDLSDFIFECKKASPSRGLIREDYNLEEIIDTYKDFASAISVLTDNKYFKGSFAHLSQVSQQVEQPVLCKDFFIDIYQVYEACHYGADAILLMLSVVNDDEYRLLANVAEELSLDVLTEVHDEIELERAIQLNAKIIGINNRNLKDLSIDIATTEKLSQLVPDEIRNKCLLISESGIKNHQDVKRLAPIVSGFLVGSSIMSEDNIRKQCKKLIYGLTKICGLTSQKDALAAFDNGAVYGGLIFHPASPRYVSPETALDIIKQVHLDYVGVFVNEPLDNLADIVLKLDLKILQLHGDESTDYINSLKERLPHCEIWKAISVKTKSTLTELDLESSTHIDRFLLDTHDAKQRGGSGRQFDWKVLNRVNKENIILAGGLNIDNLDTAKKHNTFALDINSGAEESPGKKSNDLLNKLFKKLHA